MGEVPVAAGGGWRGSSGWPEREWVKVMDVTPSLVVRERDASPLTAQMPRNSATELSTTSFLCIIFTGKGDIAEVADQLE